MRRATVVFLSVMACAIGWVMPLSAARGEAPRELGWVEKVQILPEKLTVSAKMDTGAHTSSVDATDTVEFERNGRPWVRFLVSDRDGNIATFERPVVRVVRLKRSETVTTKRHVVMLALCLGGTFREEPVTLTSRTHLLYPLLIGRSAMEGRFVVNPSRTFVGKPDCLGR